MINPRIYGYYDESEHSVPAYDPGLAAACPVCQRRLGNQGEAVTNITTISCALEDDTRSYFYRVHKTCYDSLSAEQQAELDWPIMDARARLQELN